MQLRPKVSYFLVNGKPEKIQRFPFFLFQREKSVYEVIRYEGRPLYFDDHLKRLHSSLALLMPHNSPEPLITAAHLDMLAQLNKISTGNIRIDYFPLSARSLVYFIPHHYPSPESYRHGVKLALQNDERTIPNAKTYNPEVRSHADRIIREKGVFETLLVNKNGLVTEGSRSNIFFIKGDELLSPPEDMLLPGITRKKLMQTLQHRGIKHHMMPIHQSRLADFDAAFLTGTSIRILPVAAIEDIAYQLAHPLLQKILALPPE